MRMVLDVRGMHCKSCEMLIKDVLEEIGIKSDVSHEMGTVTVVFDENKITKDQIREAIANEGYEVKSWS